MSFTLATLQMADVVKLSGVPDLSLSFKWSNDIALSFLEAYNAKLMKILDLIQFRARMGLGIALTEWIVWRLSKHVAVKDAGMRVQAGWLSVVDPRVVSSLDFELSKNRKFHDREPVGGALEITMHLLDVMYARFSRMSIYLADPIVRQALLARHLTGKNKVFESWLADTLRRLAAKYPRRGEYDEETEIYNYSAEKPVPRDFYFEDKNNEPKTQSGSVESLGVAESSKNPYLKAAKVIKELGILEPHVT